MDGTIVGICGNLFEEILRRKSEMLFSAQNETSRVGNQYFFCLVLRKSCPSQTCHEKYFIKSTVHT